MKRMLFNATQAEELRVAIVDGQKLVDLDIEHAGQEQRKSNIYKARVTRVEPSLEAVFVDYGAERHGFLPFKELTRQYVQGEDGDGTRAKIAQNLKVGQEILVQVEKDERGNKGAALTTYVSLAGRYLVLMPNNPRGGGVSRRVEGDDRAELRETLDQLDIPEGMSVIARTAGIGRTAEELKWDLNYLLQLWEAIEGAGNEVKAPELIYLESSLVVRAIRDLFQPDIGEILIDTPEIFEQAQSFMSTVMPANVNKVKLYHDDVPLFSRFQIEHQIETAYRREVSLPAGGAIVIDHTEALVSIDVNSARATRGHDIEDTAFRTNCEAADEIARQLRLRDLGGLVVIDFIDMESTKNQREVENRLRDALHHDRARVQTGKISRFGLLELSRQRLQPALSESSYIPCPRCHGVGHIRDTASSALHILRIIQEEAMKEGTGAVHAQVPVDVATFLLNEKRQDIHVIETRFKVNVLLIPNVHLETPNYEIERLRHDSEKLDAATPSYEMVTKPAEDVAAKLPTAAPESKPSRPEPVVKGITPDQPAPIAADPVARAPRAAAPAAAATKPAPSLWQRFMGLFGSEPEAPAPATKPNRDQERRDGRGGNDRSRRDGKRNDRGDRGDRGGRDGQQRPGQGPRKDREGDAQRDNKRDQRPPKAENAERAERSDGARPQEPREQKPRNAQPGKPALEAKHMEQPDGEGRGRRRRGRGGRDRGERGDRPERAERTPRNDAPAAEQTNGTLFPAEAAVVAVATAGIAVEAVSHAAPQAAPVQPSFDAMKTQPLPVAEESHEAVAPAPVAVAKPAVETASEPVAAPAAAPVAEAPAAPVSVQQMMFTTREVTFSPVDQIGDVVTPRAQPRQRKRYNEAAAAAAEPLLIIETAPDKAVAAPVVEEEAPRRRAPRPRKNRETSSEPLVFVETGKTDGDTPNNAG